MVYSISLPHLPLVPGVTSYQWGGQPLAGYFIGRVKLDTGASGDTFVELISVK